MGKGVGGRGMIGTAAGRGHRFPSRQNHRPRRAAHLQGWPTPIAAVRDRRHQSIPGSRLGHPRGPTSKGMSHWNACPATAVFHSPRATRPNTSDDDCGLIDADPAVRAAPDRTPLVEDGIRATTATRNGPRRPPPAPNSNIRPADAPPCNPIQDRNLSTDQCDMQHRLSRRWAGKRSTTSCRSTRHRG